MKRYFLNIKLGLVISCFFVGTQLLAVQVSIKVFLEGPFSGSLMSDNLRVNDRLVNQEPYAALPEFIHVNGGGTATVSNDVLNIIGNDAIVDWVFVELRSVTDPLKVLFTRSALLQRDGDIVDTNGISPLNFNNAPTGNYYVAVRHRNHLTIISNQPVSLSNISLTIDFTTSASSAFGNKALKEINGSYVMYAADIDRSGKIDLSDRNIAWNGRSNIGYLDADVDMNGVVDLVDRGLAWNNRNVVQQYPLGSNEADITVTITFDSAPSEIPNIDFTKLRFNKDFAYSLTFDDGSVAEYNVSFPIISGGTTPDGQIHEGHFYTDGCGNDQVFRGGFAIMGYHITDDPDGYNYMSWDQVRTMFDADWDLMSHSYSHCAYSNCDYENEVLENVSKIQEKVGFEVTHFCVPSGDDEGYITPAFDNGMKAVYDQHWLFPGNGGLEIVDQMDLNEFKLNRNTLEIEAIPYGEDIDHIAALSQNGINFWFSEYAHRVGYLGGSSALIQAEDLKDYMIHIEETHGRFGSDRVWVAPLQEVYEYIQVRDNAQLIATELTDNQLVLKIDLSSVPENLRRNSLTILVDTENTSTISNIVTTNSSLTYNENGLINLSW